MIYTICDLFVQLFLVWTIIVPISYVIYRLFQPIYEFISINCFGCCFSAYCSTFRCCAVTSCMKIRTINFYSFLYLDSPKENVKVTPSNSPLSSKYAVKQKRL